MPVFLALALALSPAAAAHTCVKFVAGNVPIGGQMAVQVSRRLAEQILRNAGHFETTNLSPFSEKVLLQTTGVPIGVKKIPTRGRVFRHYIRDSRNLDRILALGALRVGKRYYVNGRDMYFMQRFIDLTGVFLTDPELAADQVGLDRQTKAYIDLEVPPGTGVLELEAGIYMIPGPVHRLEIPIRIRASHH